MIFQFNHKPSRIVFLNLLGFFLLNSQILNCQVYKNVVNNPSAEIFSACPNSFDQVINADFWFKPTVTGTSDYFNVCATSTSIGVPINIIGNQIAKTGNAYFGFSLYLDGFEARENIENGLKATLSSGKVYCVSFFVSLAEESRFAVSNIGVYFTKDSLKNYWPSVPPNNYFFTPHMENNNSNIISDTINWVPVQGTFQATGVENFITIGNFRNDASTNKTQIKPLMPPGPLANIAYYYIDDISLVEINNANAFLTDSIKKCALDSVTLGTDSTEFATYTWTSTAAGLAALSCTNCPNPIAKPLVTTKYYLTKVQCSATTMDSVTVVVLTPTTQANAGNDTNICPNDILQLGISDSTNFVSYNWQFVGNSSLSCINCATPLANVQQTTEFILQRTECNIMTSDTVNVIVDLCDITIPTVFTPNGDDVNDTWKFKLPTGAKLNELNIYNRWGLLVYSLNSTQLSPNSERQTLNLQWDGYTPAGIACNEGIYFYTLSYTDKKNETKNLKGYVSLFR